MSLPWSGVFPAVTTKFTDDFALDEAWNRRHIRAQLEAGADGIILSGSLGEASTLTPEDKLELIRIATAVVDGSVPVLCGVHEGSTEGARRFVKRAAEAGADGFMLLPPMLYRSDPRETVRHLRAVADATDRPIMLYNNPVSYGVDLTPDVLAELAEEERFVAIKESSDDVRRITDILNRVGDRYQIFCGVDDLALEAMVLGAVGWVAGLVCAFPRETVAIHRLVKAGRVQEALEIYRWFMPLLHLDVSTKLVQNIKLAEVKTGMGTETVRPPRLPLAGQERARVEAVIDEALARRPEIPEGI